MYGDGVTARRDIGKSEAPVNSGRRLHRGSFDGDHQVRDRDRVPADGDKPADLAFPSGDSAEIGINDDDDRAAGSGLGQKPVRNQDLIEDALRVGGVRFLEDRHRRSDHRVRIDNTEPGGLELAQNFAQGSARIPLVVLCGSACRREHKNKKKNKKCSPHGRTNGNRFAEPIEQRDRNFLSFDPRLRPKGATFLIAP